MKKNIAILSIVTFTLLASALNATDGKKVFETYCWGCHHQTAVAFGPPFEEMASKRTTEQIKAMIIDPKSVSKLLGYKRNAMPPFQLSDENLTAITRYIFSYKSEDVNSSNACYAYSMEDVNSSKTLDSNRSHSKELNITKEKK